MLLNISKTYNSIFVDLKVISCPTKIQCDCIILMRAFKKAFILQVRKTAKKSSLEEAFVNPECCTIEK